MFVGQENPTPERHVMADRYKIPHTLDEKSGKHVADCPWPGCSWQKANASKRYAVDAVSGHMVVKHGTSITDTYVGFEQK